MKILIKNATVYDDRSPVHLQKTDILIIDGLITKIASEISESADHVISSPELCVSPGWLDIGPFNGEPGYEQREDLHSLKNAAAKGGYAYIAPLPNTNPTIDSKSQINFLQRQNDFHATEILPIAAASIGANGIDMSEVIDLVQSGAIAISDGYKSNISKGNLVRIMQYVKGIGATYIHYLPSNVLSADGQINEGEMSILLGMEGIAAIEEIISVQEVLAIAEYVDYPIRIQNISTSAALKLIEKSKSDVTVSVPYLNLTVSEGALRSFDVNLKVLPPLRQEAERKALIKAINKGKINCITSNHMPIKVEDKDKEFGLSKFGAIGLETCFAGIWTFATDINLDRVVYCLSQGAYDMLGLPCPSLSEGEKSVLTLFDPSLDIKITPHFIESKSLNTPFLNKTLKGKILGVINGKKTSFVS